MPLQPEEYQKSDMLPYPQSCQGQRKDREEAKDIVAECVGVLQVSTWIGSPIQVL